ncbi:hypothetical protein [Silvimonas soli]|nr:hypothetical protein [Silvimonas soli]
MPLWPDKQDALGWYPLDALPQNIVPYTRQGLEGARIGRIYSTFPTI